MGAGASSRAPTHRAVLPFWRVTARISGLTIESWADLVRFANLPKVVRAEWRDERAVFWIPGFKAQPDQFLRMAQAATLARPGRQAGIEPGRRSRRSRGRRRCARATR